MVVIDGLGFDSLDLSTISSTTHAIQFDTAASTGHIEYNDGTATEAITSITPYQSIINAHQALKDAQPLIVELTAQEVINNDSRVYLTSTDWYITRHAETAVAVPADVTTARATARAAIV